jgi:hypothetical protein
MPALRNSPKPPARVIRRGSRILKGAPAAFADPGLVQVKQGSGTGTSLTITLDSPTGTGNSLIVVIAASGTSTNPTAIACTLGGVTDNFAQDSTFGSASDAAIGATWRDQPAASGQTSVGITATGGSGTIAITATVYERSDLAATPFDKTANSVSAGSTSWTSTATATTAQASEVAIGAVFTTASGAATITGPAPPWTNLAQVTQVQGSFTDQWMSGWQVLSSTQAVTYSGTVSTSSQWIAKVVTYELAAASTAARAPQVISQYTGFF